MLRDGNVLQSVCDVHDDGVGMKSSTKERCAQYCMTPSMGTYLMSIVVAVCKVVMTGAVTKSKKQNTLSSMRHNMIYHHEAFARTVL